MHVCKHTFIITTYACVACVFVFMHTYAHKCLPTCMYTYMHRYTCNLQNILDQLSKKPVGFSSWRIYIAMGALHVDYTRGAVKHAIWHICSGTYVMWNACIPVILVKFFIAVSWYEVYTLTYLSHVCTWINWHVAFEGIFVADT